MKKIFKILKETKIKGSIFFSVIVACLIIFGSISVRMMKDSYSMSDTGGVEIFTPTKVLLGAPSGWEQYRGSVVYNWDDFQIEINNTSSYQMTNISLNLSGTGNITGDNGGTQGFELNNMPSSLSAGDSRTVRGYGAIAAADNWTDTDETLTISYQLNGTQYNVSRTVHFYSYEPVTYSNLPQPTAVEGNFTYVYTNQNENLYIKIPRTNIYMDKSENLEDFHIKPQYKTAFGNTVIMEHPQTGNTDNVWKSLSPRMWDYFSYSKVGNSTDITLWDKSNFQEPGHELTGTPSTTTNGVVNVYLPVLGHYCKKSGCNWTGYNYKTNEGQFDSSNQPVLNVSIYDKSGLYDLIYQAQVHLDLYDSEYYNVSTYQGYIDNAVSINGNRVTTQPAVDEAKTRLNEVINATPTEKDADYSALGTALSGIDSSIYTTESWNTFNTTYVESQDIYQNRPYKKKQQRLVDEQVDKLNAAKSQLVLKPADYSAVDTAISQAETARDTQATIRENQVYIYTDATRTAVTTAINNVVRGKTAAEQSDVDGYATAINNAKNALTEKDADYSLVTTAIGNANTAIAQMVGNVTLYTDDSIAVVTTTINAVVQGKKITEQSTVDGYATDIDNAVLGLQKRPADYTALNSAVSAATEKKETKVNVRGNQVYLYTDATRQALETVLSGIDYNKKIDEQSDVDGYVTSVNSASTALVEKPADYTDIDTSIDAATTAIATKYQEQLLYTQTSIDAVTSAISNVVRNLNIDRQNDIDGWKSAIDSAVAALQKKPADYSALNSAVSAAETARDTKVSVRGNQEYYYTSATRTAVTNAINAIDSNKKIDEQSDVNAYTTAVNQTVAALAPNPADYTSVDSTILSAQAEIAQKVGEEYLYTATSRQAVTNAINAVTRNLNIDRQDDIDTWEAAITTAVGALVENTSDYSAVEDAISAATTKKETKVSVRGEQVYLYTDATRQAVEAAIAAVEEQLPITDQDKVDKFAEDIEAAADALAKKPADYTTINTSIDAATTKITTTYGAELLYTQESITAVQAELNKVVTGLTIESQDTIDGWKSAIDTATAAMEKKPADYTAVEDAISAATAKKETKVSVRGDQVYLYTDATREAVEDAIDAVVTGKKLDEQQTVDGYTTAINSASNALAEKQADYAAVNASIATAQTEIAKTHGEKLLYTTDSINAVNTAINAVVENLNISRQDDIDTWKSEIDTAVTNLVVAPADYAKVNASVTAANTAIAQMAGSVTLYTDESIAVVNTALAKVTSGKLITDQEEVDGWADEIDEAVEDLEKRPADYSAVNTAKANAIAARDTQATIRGEATYIYTTTTRDNVTTILGSIVEGLKIDEQSRVDGYVTTINSAVSGLVEKDASYDLVNAAIDAAEDKIETQAEGENLYTDTSIEAVEATIAAVVEGRKITAQAEVDGWADDINTAAAAMEKKPADYSTVNSAISAATTKKDTTASVRGETVYVYTNETIQAVEDAINAVVTGKKLDEQQTVNGYATAINNAANQLVKKNASYTEINTSIDTATTEIAKKVGEKPLYTNDSITNVQTALNAVESNLTIEYQDTIDGWKDAIDQAVEDLVVSPADYTRVNASIASANEAISETVGSVTLYTDESIAVVTTVINKVTAGKDITEQAEVDGWADEIDDAVEALEKRLADYTALNSAVSDATTKKETKVSVRGEQVYLYTDTTRQALETVLSGIDYNKKIDQQSTVDGYVTSVNSAADALVEKGADYNGVNASIDAATTEIAKKVGEKTLYTAESIAAVQTELNKVVTGLTIESQDTIDGWSAAIDQAVEDLVVSPADYTALNASIATAQTEIAKMEGNVTLYTDDSIAAVQTELNKVVQGKDITEQSVVDGWKTEIDNAVTALQKRPADYSAVNTAKANAIAARDTQASIRGVDTYIYTDTSRADVSTVLAGINEGLKIDQQSTVDGYVTTINAAVSALVEKDADYSLVTAAVSSAQTEIAKTAGGETLYTDDSIAAVQTELNKVVNGRKITAQSEVDGWATSITTAVTVLVKKDADYAALNSAIEAATTKKETKVSVRGEQVYLYTDTTREAVETALSAVEQGKKLDEQSTVDGWTSAINTASDALVEKGADYTAINESIDIATTEINKKYKEKNLYTDTSIERVQTALNAVVENLTIESQDTIDGWKQAIDTAVSQLEKTGADYTAVADAIEAANAKKATTVSVRGSDTNLYTQASIDAVDAAIAAVVDNLPIESQSEVNGYAQAINAAAAALEKQPADYTDIEASISEATGKITTMQGEKYLYTQTTRDAVQAALDDVVENLTIEHQDTIDGWKQAIDTAVAALVKNDADYDALDDAIEAAETKRDTTVSVRGEQVYLYTDATRQAVTTEIEKVERDKKIDQQDEVEAYITAINAASAALEKRPADYSDVNTSINTATTEITKKYNEKLLYTTTSINRVQTAIDAVVENLTIENQDTIDTWEQAIDTAVGQLEKNNADYSALNSAVSAATEKKETKVSVRGEQVYQYTQATREAVETAINAIVYNLKIDEQETVDGYLADVNTASAALEKVEADYTAVNASIEEAETKITTKVGTEYLYTQTTRQAVQTELNKVVTGLTIESQDTIDGWKSAIDTAVANLVKNPADYSAVNSAIISATTTKETKVNVRGQEEYLYTETTRTAVQTAIDSVVNNLPIDQQTTVDGYVSTITTAVGGLIKNPAYYNLVDSAITTAEEARDTTAEIRGEEVNIYTATSRSQVTTAINNVVRNLYIDEQETVDSYATAITNAKNALVEKDASYDLVNASIVAADEAISQKAGNTNLYTDDSIALVNAAKGNVVLGRKITAQAEVDGWATAIDTAVANLVKNTADYSGVTTAITNAQTKRDTTVEARGEYVNLYTEDSRQAVTDAINAVVYNLPIDEQQTVTAYATAINQASDALVKEDASYNLVETAKTNAITARDTTAEIRGEEVNIYTNTSRQAVTDAINAVEYNLPIDRQAEVDGYATAINNAVSALEEKDADYSLVTAATNTANAEIIKPAENTTLYTDDSIAAVQTELNKVVSGRKITAQAEVDGWATSINNAVAALQKRPANYDAVNSAISAAIEKKETKVPVRGQQEYLYTKTTRDAVDAAIAAVNNNLKIDEQQTVNGYAQAINTASNNLEKVEADYEDITASINTATTEIAKKAGTEYLYTQTSRNAVTEAINAVTYNLTIEKQNDIDAWQEAIDQAVESLVKNPADYSAVEDAISAATTKKEIKVDVRGNNEYLYTQATREAVESAISAVVNNLTIDKQEQVNSYAQAINAASDALEECPADYTVVNASIDSATTEIAKMEGNDHLYTQTSRNAVQSAIDAVIKNLTIEHQNDIDAWKIAIDTAVLNLVKNDADYDALDDAIEAAKAKRDTKVTVRDEREYLYTSDSRQAVTAKIEKVERDKKIDEQDEVDAYITAINAASAALEKRKADYSAITESINDATTEITKLAGAKLLYTTTSINRVQAAIDAVIPNLTIEYQDDIDTWKENIDTEVSRLEKNDADYEALNSAVTAADAKKEEKVSVRGNQEYQYTEDSRQAVQAAIDAVVYNLKIDKQDEVDGYTAAINTASDALVKVNADYSLLTSSINTATTKITTKVGAEYLYTATTRQAVQDAIDAVTYNLTIEYQDDIDTWKINIDTAVTNLVKNKADYAQVTNETNAAKTKKETKVDVAGVQTYLYTETSRRAVELAIESVEENLPIDEQETVDGYASAIKNAADALVKENASYTAINNVIDAATAKIALKYKEELLYTDTSIARVNEAIAAVEYNLTIERQNDINAWQEAIETADEALVKKTAHYDDLNTAITDARDKENTQVMVRETEEYLYTDTTRQAVETAINNVTYNLPLDEQETVDNYKTAIDIAKEALIKKRAYYDRVTTAVTNATTKKNTQEMIREENVYIYTETTRQAVQSAIDAVVENLTLDKQTQVDNFATAITEASDALVEKNAEYDLVEEAQTKAQAEIIKEAESTTLYTEDTIAVVTEALGKVVSGRKITAQEEVDGWATEINDAVSGLVKRDANYDAVTDAINAATEKKETKVDVRGSQVYLYTSDSRDAVQTAINSVEYNLKIDEQQTVNGYAAAITTASNNLVKENADYTAINAVKNNATTEIAKKVGAEYLYTETTRQAVKTAIDAVVSNLTIEKQNDIDAWQAAITTAVGQLQKNPADYDELNNAIAAAEEKRDTTVSVRGNQEYLYTEATRSALTTIINNIDRNKKIDEQADVDNYTTTVNTASDALAEVPADYTAVNASKSTAETEIAKMEGDIPLYTQTSRNTVQAAIDAIITNLNISRQDDIDAWKEAIDDAVEHLVKNDANYDALDDAIEAAEEKRDIKVTARGEEVYQYTKTSRDAVTAEIAKVKRDKKIDEQSEVDAYITAINTASDALAKVNANYDAVTATINDATDEITKKVGVEYLYTQTSRNRVQAAINAVVENLTIEHQDQIDTWEAAITTAVGQLEKNPGDYDALNSAVAAAETKRDTKVSVRGNQEYQYTETSRNAVTDAISSVDYGKKIDEQNDIDAYTAAITTASANLVKENADYSSINETIDYATTEIAKLAGEKYLYTESSRQVVQNALNAVESNLTIEHQNEIDTWEQTIITAVSNLVKIKADYTEVTKIISKYHSSEGYTNSWYTEESMARLEEYITPILDSIEAGTQYTADRQDEVNAMTVRIAELIQALELKPADYSEVNTLIEEYHSREAYQRSWYTEDTQSTVDNYIENYVDNYTINMQNEVNTIRDNLSTYISQLVLKDADYSRLEDAINSYHSNEYYQKHWYTEESQEPVETFISNYNKEVTIDHQATVDAMLENFNNMLNNFELINADYEEADEVLEAAENLETKTSKGYDLYTKETYNKLQTAIDEYRNLSREYKINEQSIIDNAKEKISNAIHNLEKNPADYSKLNDLIAKINTLNKDNYKNFNIIEKVLENIVYEKKIDEQDEVDAMYEALQKAYNSLEEKEKQKTKEAIITSIQINGNEVDLNKTPFKYVVDSSTDTIDIKVTLDDEDEEYEIIGDKNISTGENEFIIKVGNKKFKLIVVRQAASNYLKDLIIDGYKIGFKKEEQKYQLTINLSDYKLKIKAIPEDELAKVEIKGNEDIINGSVIEIIVTATDGAKRTYKLEITKELLSYVEGEYIVGEATPQQTIEKVAKVAVPAVVGTGTTISLFYLLGLVFRKRF